MGTARREDHPLPRIFRGRRGRAGPGRGAGLFRPRCPIAGRTVSRAVRPLRRKENSAQGPRRRLRVRLRCRVDPASGRRNVDLLPFRPAGHECPFGRNFPGAQGRLTHVQPLFAWNPSPRRPFRCPLKYLLLSPRSAPGGAPPGLAPRASSPPPRPPTPRGPWLPRGRGVGGTLERHPFSGLVHSAGELLHSP